MGAPLSASATRPSKKSVPRMCLACARPFLSTILPPLEGVLDPAVKHTPAGIGRASKPNLTPQCVNCGPKRRQRSLRQTLVCASVSFSLLRQQFFHGPVQFFRLESFCLIAGSQFVAPFAAPIVEHVIGQGAAA